MCSSWESILGDSDKMAVLLSSAICTDSNGQKIEQRLILMNDRWPRNGEILSGVAFALLSSKDVEPTPNPNP